jgi:hypothetical protein
VAGDSAPGHALFLEKVIYPDDIWLWQEVVTCYSIRNSLYRPKIY